MILHKILLLLLYAYKISTQTKSQVFLEYSPHVDKISVRIFENGWKENCSPTKDEGIYLSDEMYFGTTASAELDKAIMTLKDLHRRNKK